MRTYFGEEHSIGAGRRLSDGSCCDLDVSDAMVMQAEDTAEGRRSLRLRPAVPVAMVVRAAPVNVD